MVLRTIAQAKAESEISQVYDYGVKGSSILTQILIQKRRSLASI